ncbi:hypothetical protein Tsubulata_036237 [Turnera subulata]|uniref:JmjC domain-containing protein n=1 Tax=Turnera subulata TaxID=218843 RepID=A0A9Q0GMJ2_9ROSI|nr:hypothetical protein Tsubulata_036237 [Turnera subulata]
MKSGGGRIIEKLWEEVRELSLGSDDTRINRLDSPPTPLQFLRDYVSQNKPCIISNAISHWPALSRWPHLPYLSRSLSTSLVSLHLTPNGRADSIVPLPDHNKDDDLSSSLCFASAHQNDCFRTEYSGLAADCDPDVPWATEALGCSPDAVNLWIGNHLSETSFHKDHYENLYAVVSGEKHFLLLPPTDVHRMYIRPYPAAQYSYSHETGEFSLEVEQPTRFVPWSSVDPFPSPETREAEMDKFPLYFRGPKPFQCTIKAGEVLYLPSMWFHHVRQSPGDDGCCTIAVNYWYDMQFDIKCAYFNFLQSIPYGSLPPETRPEGSPSQTDVSEMSEQEPDEQNGDQ